MSTNSHESLSTEDLSRNLKRISAKSGAPLEDVAINYYLGPGSWLLYKVAQDYGLVKNEDDLVIIGAGAGAAHANANRAKMDNWKRSTGDIDVHRLDVSIKDFEVILKAVSEEMRDMMKRVYGSSIYRGQDIEVKRVEEGLMTTTNAQSVRMLRGDLIIPEAEGLPKSKIYYEADSGAFNFLHTPISLDVSHPYIDREELKLGQIKVPTFGDYLGLKIVGLLFSLSSTDTSIKASRLKDLFDIWYLVKHLKIPFKDISDSVDHIINNRVRQEVRDALRRTGSAILKSPNQYLQNLSSIIAEDLHNGKKIPTSELLKMHTSGLYPAFNYPSENEIALTLVSVFKHLNLK